MAKITALKAQKKTGRINVYIDDIFFCGISEKLIVDFGLYKGKELTNAEAQKLKKSEDFSRALNYAYRLLSFRPRSEKEIIDKLTSKYPEITVKKIVQKLKTDNYLNDYDFAKIWIEQRQTSRGKKLLISELYKKGIAKNIIEELIETIDDNESYNNAKALIRKKNKYKDISKTEAYKKVGLYLARRGFSYDIIKKVITDIYKH